MSDARQKIVDYLRSMSGAVLYNGAGKVINPEIFEEGADCILELAELAFCRECQRRLFGQEAGMICRSAKCPKRAKANVSSTSPLQGNAESPSSSDLNATGAITRPPE